MSRICQFGRSIIGLEKWLFYSAGIAALIMVAGCSTAKPPTDILTRAELSARTADEARAAELAQNVPQHFVVCGKLVVDPNIFNRQSEFLEEVKEEFQLRIAQALASDSDIECGDANDRK